MDALKTLRINRSRPQNLATCALGDSLVHQQWHSPSSWNIKRDFYWDVNTILNQILLTIWTMCAFRVLKPRQWSLAKQSSLKRWKVMPKMSKQAEAKRDGVINPQNYNFNQISTRNILTLSERNGINLRRPQNLATCALGDSLVHQQWHSPSSWNIKRDFYWDVNTILNQILLTIWTICAFRVLKPRQWSLTKQSSLKRWNVMPKYV